MYLNTDTLTLVELGHHRLLLHRQEKRSHHSFLTHSTTSKSPHTTDTVLEQHQLPLPPQQVRMFQTFPPLMLQLCLLMSSVSYSHGQMEHLTTVKLSITTRSGSNKMTVHTQRTLPTVMVPITQSPQLTLAPFQ